MNRRYLALFLLLATGLVLAQESTLDRARRKLEAWRASRATTLMNDFGELARYRETNAALALPQSGENRVVFFGDSITDGWALSKYFPGKNYLNRGISGQTTSQMVVRFRQDVVDLHPRVVVILAGTNDIAGNTGPMTLEQTESNLASMAEIAHANGIRVILSSVLPVHDYTASSMDYFPLRPPTKIVLLNKWVKQYCDDHDEIYLDYFSPMIDSAGLLKREYAEDGLHPNSVGYSVMAPLVEAAIQKALDQPSAQKIKPGN